MRLIFQRLDDSFLRQWISAWSGLKSVEYELLLMFTESQVIHWSHVERTIDVSCLIKLQSVID